MLILIFGEGGSRKFWINTLHVSFKVHVIVTTGRAFSVANL